MIIDAKSGLRGVLVDASTGQRIPFARWANLDTGEYEALSVGPDGRPSVPARPYRGKTSLRFVESYAPKVADRPAGVVDERAAEQELEEFRRTTQRRLLVPGDFCEVRGCHRLAEWSVGWTKLLSPVLGPDGRPQERLGLTELHDYCSRHYRLPRQTSQRNVESEIQVAARPQW